MAVFQVDSEQLSSRSVAVQGSIARLQGEVNTMQAGLRELEGCWQGAAASGFQAVLADWRATQARVEESLTGINAALLQASQHYAQAEEANTRMFLH